MAANVHAMPMKVKNVIQSASDMEYSCLIEDMVQVSDSPEAQMNILGMAFPAKFVKFDNLKTPMLILTVVLGKCIKLSPYLDKPFPFFSSVTP